MIRLFDLDLGDVTMQSLFVSNRPMIVLPVEPSPQPQPGGLDSIVQSRAIVGASCVTTAGMILLLMSSCVIAPASTTPR